MEPFECVIWARTAVKKEQKVANIKQNYVLWRLPQNFPMGLIIRRG
jgi:hypothetical protein